MKDSSAKRREKGPADTRR